MQTRQNEQKNGDATDTPRIVPSPVLTGGGKLALLDRPRAVIDLASWQTVLHFARLCDTEIKGRGTVEVSGSEFLLGNPFILGQKVNRAQTDDSRAFNAFYAQLASQGREKEVARYCLEWHSHVDMPPFFSDEDCQTIAGYTVMFDWMVLLVLNRRAEYQCRLDVYNPVRLSIELPLYVVLPAPSIEIDLMCRQAIEEHVHKSFLADKLSTLLGLGDRLPQSSADGSPIVMPAELLTMPDGEENL